MSSATKFYLIIFCILITVNFVLLLAGIYWIKGYSSQVTARPQEGVTVTIKAGAEISSSIISPGSRRRVSLLLSEKYLDAKIIIHFD